MNWETAFNQVKAWALSLTPGMVKSWAVSAMTGLTGWRLWLAKAVLKYAVAAAKKIASDAAVKAEISKQLDKTEGVLNDPNASADDIRNAGDDLLK